MNLVTHYVTQSGRRDPFTNLKLVLENGFRSKSFPNAILREPVLFAKERHLFPISRLSSTEGDIYALVFRTRDLDFVHSKKDYLGTLQVGLKHARAEQVRKLAIKISDSAGPEERARRIAFYRAEISRIKAEKGLKFELEFF